MKLGKRYIEFIKYSILLNSEVSIETECIDWADYFQFCNRQGVIGLVFGGLERSGVKIPQMTLFEWISYSESIKQQNSIIDKRISQISTFFRDRGIRSVVLKGQTNGKMYPKPELRSPGDIDLWCEGKDIDIIKVVRDACPNAKYSLHHIKMPVFKDVSVEVHYSPVHLCI